jgi:hypothetical protein
MAHSPQVGSGRLLGGSQQAASSGANAYISMPRCRIPDTMERKGRGSSSSIHRASEALEEKVGHQQKNNKNIANSLKRKRLMSERDSIKRSRTNVDQYSHRSGNNSPVEQRIKNTNETKAILQHNHDKYLQDETI